MKTIKVLGSGCKKCIQTVQIVQDALEALNIEAEVIKVEDIQEIITYNVLSTPAILVDEKVIFKGRIPTLNEAIKVFQ